MEPTPHPLADAEFDCACVIMRRKATGETFISPQPPASSPLQLDHLATRQDMYQMVCQLKLDLEAQLHASVTLRQLHLAQQAAKEAAPKIAHPKGRRF